MIAFYCLLFLELKMHLFQLNMSDVYLARHSKMGHLRSLIINAYQISVLTDLSVRWIFSLSRSRHQ